MEEGVMQTSFCAANKTAVIEKWRAKYCESQHCPHYRKEGDASQKNTDLHPQETPRTNPGQKI